MTVAWAAYGPLSRMYATRLVCNKPLGRNECLESFRFGGRLVLDPAKERPESDA